MIVNKVSLIALIFLLIIPPLNMAYSEENPFVLRGVTLTGISEEQRDALNPYLIMDKSTWLRKRYFTLEDARQDLRTIEDYFRINGYLNVESPKLKIDTLAEKHAVNVTIDITTNAQTFIDSISFSGNSVFQDSVLKSVLLLQEDRAFNANDLSSDTWNLVNHYSGMGYINANVRPETKWDTTANRISITFAIVEGLPVTIDSVKITGNEKTELHVIERELTLNPGERFTYTDVLESQSNLYTTGLFSSVRIDLEEDSTKSDTLRNVIIQVRERAAGEIAIGGGYGTETKERISFRLYQGNFQGTGKGAGMDLKFSAIRHQFEVSYTDPWFYSKRNSLDVVTFARQLEDPTFTQSRYGTQWTFGRKVSSIGRLNTSYLFKKVKLSDIGSDKIIDSSGTTNSIRVAFVEDRRNNIINPSKGYYLETALEYAPSFPGDAKSFVKFTVDNRQYIPVHAHLTLAWWGSIGFLWQVDRNRPIPTFERFFAGGERSMRGFDRNSLGPKDMDTGLPLGGKVLVLQNLELRFPLIKNLSFITFLDIGNVYDRYSDVGFDSFRAGFGPGLRYSFFLGVVGLDYAWKWDPRPGESPGKLHFNIGHTF